MDFTKLRAQALNHGEDEEAVTVNTRALIDKVLARYSGEWTTLRELLQNAADAQAQTVKIKFETIPSTTVPLPGNATKSELLRHTLLYSMLCRLLVSNDGLPFGDNDWARLKRIAEGNPNEDKIGAFGVGFYSVFADCEEPFVSSGKKAMAFYWKKDSLFTRQIQVPDGTEDTNFVLDYRNSTSPVPSLVSLSQFLATSLTFVALQNIELWLDDWKILSLQKKASPKNAMAIPRDIETTTKEGMMKVQSLERQSVQMDATFMNVVGWRPSSATSVPKSSAFGETTYGRAGTDAPSLRSFFSRLTTSSTHQALRTKAVQEERDLQEIVLEDLTTLTAANVFLSVTTATIRTRVSSSFSAELERATKKPPPKTTTLALLSSSYDEANASKEATKSDKIAKSVDIFSSVLPGRTNGGRIFIGFPTNQTTGAGVHLSAPSLIPTVEREAIDLNARWVRTWNMEMLRVAGIMSRVAYGIEMADLGTKLQRWTQSAGRAARMSKEDIEKFIPEALHIITSYTFEDSTPNAQISQIIEESFWTAFKKASIEIYSTRGVLPTTTVRLATEDLSGFVEGIPVLPVPLVSSKLVKKLRDYGLVTEITISDVKKELGAKALTTSQLVAFISWAGQKSLTRAIDGPTINGLLDSAVAIIGEDQNQGGIITLSSIKYFVQPTKIPPEFPLPHNTLPFELTKSASHEELIALGWEPLGVAVWVRFLVESTNGRNGLSAEQDITWSPKFSSQMLAVLSKQWDSLSTDSKRTIADLLTHLTVIPTKLGMKKPKESYFSSVKLFDDLPTIQGCPGVKEKFLGALGVRKTVDLDTIFQRLLTANSSNGEAAGSPKWNHIDLIVYLAGVREDIPVEDMRKLRETPICAAEAGPPGHESTVGTTKLYKISELFEPKVELRNLGLPIIQWTTKINYRFGSAEAKFLTSLGLRSQPTVPELVDLMASPDLSTRSKGMAYFIANYERNGYGAYILSTSKTPFLPIEGNEKRLCLPSECFASEKSTLLGFNVLKRELVAHASKFGVAEHPPLADAVRRLIAKPPSTQNDAKVIFSYFNARTGEREFIVQAVKLGDSRIVPIIPKRNPSGSMFAEKGASEKAGGVKHLAPKMCFIGQSDTYRDIFDFVDFGEEANRFLLACGSSHEPSRLQIASMLASEPARVLGIVQSPEKYLSLLALLAMSKADLKREKALWSQMLVSPFLLATKEISGTSDTKATKNLIDLDDEDDEVGSIKQWTLQPASKIVIVDDYTTYQLFKSDLYCAPLEESLEDFYLSLGSLPISKLVEQKVSIGRVVDDRGQSISIQKKILERSKVFLHSYPTDQLRHSKGWLEKNLNVRYVSHISIRISLRGYPVSHSLKQTAFLSQEPAIKKWFLHITEGVDYYDISQALVRHLLKRPNNEAATLFESLLTSDLQGLKRRGFNVDRILRAKAAESRIAEEARQKQLQLEQENIKTQEEQFRQNQIESQAHSQSLTKSRHSQEIDMPGAFGSDSPSPVQPQKKPRGLFSNLTRNWFKEGDAQEQLQNFLGGHGSQGGSETKALPEPPSYEDATKAQKHQSGVRRPGEAEAVSSPATIHQNLVNAIQASRAHQSSGVFSPPKIDEVQEQSSFCDVTPGQNISHVGETRNGMRIYASRDLSISPEVFLSQNIVQLQAFAKMLYEVGDIYGIPRNALNITYDEVGSTIAFNLQGSYFCNLRFFLQLHWAGFKAGTRVAEAASWWWVVLAHELAHNIVKEHNASHSYYTEGFIAQYLPQMVQKMNTYNTRKETEQEIAAQAQLAQQGA